MQTLTVKDLTEEDRRYARDWASAREKHPWTCDWFGATKPEFGWVGDYAPGGDWWHQHAAIPLEVCDVMKRLRYDTIQDAWDALALTLKRMRAAAEIPGGAASET